MANCHGKARGGEMMAKDNRKICPMPGFLYCKKEKCAWWDILAGDCAIVVIAKLGLEGSFNAITKEIKR